jgi:hypothetical protein
MRFVNCAKRDIDSMLHTAPAVAAKSIMLALFNRLRTWKAYDIFYSAGREVGDATASLLFL